MCIRDSAKIGRDSQVRSAEISELIFPLIPEFGEAMYEEDQVAAFGSLSGVVELGRLELCMTVAQHNWQWGPAMLCASHRWRQCGECIHFRMRRV